MAGAVGLGYSSMFVTAPSAENLQTVFEFLVKGLNVLKYSVGDVMSSCCSLKSFTQIIQSTHLINSF